jgi:hypothetical protein
MTIEPDGDGFKVVGRPNTEVENEAYQTGAKREREEELGEENKRVKLDGQKEEEQSDPLSKSSVVTPQADLPQDEGQIETKPSEPTTSSRAKGKGDIFLAEGVREKLASTLDVSPPPQVRHMADDRRKQSHLSHSTSQTKRSTSHPRILMKVSSLSTLLSRLTR